MNLNIKNNTQEDLTDFCSYLISYIQKTLPSFIDDKKLIKFDDFLNNTLKDNQFIYKQRRYLSCKEILISSTYNLKINKLLNNFIIEVNKDKIIPNTYIKYIDIIKLINNGNLSLQAYPIYDKIMDHIANNISELYEQFESNGVR